MIRLSNGQGIDLLLAPIYGLLYGVPAYLGACGVRRLLRRFYT